MNTNHFVSKSNDTNVIFDAKVLASNAEDCARLCSHFRHAAPFHTRDSTARSAVAEGLKATLTISKPLSVQNDAVFTQFLQILSVIEFSSFIPSNLTGVRNSGRTLESHPDYKQTF